MSKKLSRPLDYDTNGSISTKLYRFVEKGKMPKTPLPQDVDDLLKKYAMVDDLYLHWDVKEMWDGEIEIMLTWKVYNIYLHVFFYKN